MSSSSEFEVIQYTVQPGDTFWDITDQYDIDEDDLIDANPEVDFNNLVAGQAIVIPDPPPAHRPEHRPERRPRRRPEREFRHRRPYYRYPYYRHPYYRPYYPTACPAGTTPYSIQPGESLYSIASRFGVSVDAVIAANPYVNFGIPLQIGQVICLPI